MVISVKGENLVLTDSVNYEFPTLSIPGSINQKINSVSKDLFQTLQKVNENLIYFKVASIVLAPIQIYNIVKDCFSFIRGNLQKKIDSSLNILKGLRDLTGTVGVFILGLGETGVISLSSVAWASPFATGLSVLSGISIIQNIRTCAKMRKLTKEIENVEKTIKAGGGSTLESYRGVITLLDKKQFEDKDFIKEVFNVKQKKKFVNCLFSLETRALEKEESERDKMLEEAIVSLKGRVRKNIISSALSIVASTINIIGTVVLLACPVVPVGWAILGIGAVVDISRGIHHKVSEWSFAKEIQMQRKWLEWITC